MGRKIMNEKNKPKKNNSENKKKVKRREYYISMLDKKKNIKPPICKYFTYGSCKMDDCIYSHDVTPDQMKKFDEMCKYYAVGECAKGEMCCYMHKTFPCIFFHNKLGNKCNKGEKCLFSHEPLSEAKSVILENHLKNQSNRGKVIEEKASENLIPVQSNFGQSIFFSCSNSDNFGKSIFPESGLKINEANEAATKVVVSGGLVSENEIEDQNLKITKENTKSIVPIQSNFGKSTLNSENFVRSFNFGNFGWNVLQDSRLANRINENMTSDASSGNSISENDSENQNLKITEENVPMIIETAEKLPDGFVTNENNTKPINEPDSDSQLVICENISTIDKFEIHAERKAFDNKRSDILEKLAFNFDNIPKFTKIDFSDSSESEVDNEIFIDERKPRENCANNEMVDANNTIDDSDTAIDHGNGDVIINNNIQTKEINNRSQQMEIIENIKPKLSSMHHQIQELSTRDSIRSQMSPDENKLRRKQQIVNEKKIKNFKKPNNQKISPKSDNYIDLNKSNIPFDIETKFFKRESQISDCSNEDDDDLFSGFSTHNFTVTKSSMELLGFDKQHCIELENFINASDRKNENFQSSATVKSQPSSEIGFLNSSLDTDNININDFPVINRTGGEMDQYFQTEESRNSDIADSFDEDTQNGDSIGIWKPPLLLILPQQLEYRQMNIKCYNLRHKFDDPRIRNHPKALKQSALEWLNS